MNRDPGRNPQSARNYYDDIFLSKFNSSRAFQWVYTAGGSSNDSGTCISVESDGTIYLAGYFDSSVDFDPGGGQDVHISKGQTDFFVVRLDSDGEYQWSRSWGGPGTDIATGVGVDSSGKIYLTGFFWSQMDFSPGPGTVNRTPAGERDIFLYQILPTGEWY